MSLYSKCLSKYSKSAIQHSQWNALCTCKTAQRQIPTTWFKKHAINCHNQKKKVSKTCLGGDEAYNYLKYLPSPPKHVSERAETTRSNLREPKFKYCHGGPYPNHRYDNLHWLNFLLSHSPHKILVWNLDVE